METQPRAGKWSDRAGVFLSGLCILHCLLIPILAPIFPLFALAGRENHFHEFLFTPLLLIAGFAFWRGYQIHRARGAAILGGLGITCLILSVLIFGKYHGEVESLVLSALGSILLICAHLWNMRLCRCQHSCFHPGPKL